MTRIAVRNLTKRFGDVTALDDQTLEIESGEFVALLGPSGCGKTTLLRSIAGLEEPTAGEISIGEKTMFSSGSGINVRPGERGVGMVFQSYALWPHMTVNDNVGFGLRVKRADGAAVDEKVGSVLVDLGLGDLGKRYPFELSGGQQQRVALARLLVGDSPVFLMDEPLSNLDARLRLDMRSEIKRLHREQGATTVYVTHDQSEALTMASRVVVMNQGRIQQVGTPDEVYSQPANLFVAEFVGLPRINLLPASVSVESGRTVLQTEVLDMQVDWASPSAAMVVAVRPEDIALSLKPLADSRPATVYSILTAGPEEFINARFGDTTLVVRNTNQGKFEVDQEVWVSVRAEKCNFYQQATGQLHTPTEER